MKVKHAWLGALGLLAASPALAGQRNPPQPQCLDARQIVGAEGINGNVLALRLKDGQRFRVQLAQQCPSPENRLSVLGAADGWLCGAAGEALAIGDARCAIDKVAPLDARDYADLLRERDQQGVPTLAPVQAEAPPPARGFRGSADYCVGVDHVRSWSEDPQGVTVEVSPRHAAGNRFYRVELAGDCPALSNAQTMTLVSGTGIGMVCGHPGDRMQLLRPEREAIRPGDRANRSRPHECHISRIYPIPGKR